MGGTDSWLAHSDGIGSTTILTDETGAVVYKAGFDPWGRLVESGGPRPWFSFAGLQFPVNDPSIPSATREYNDGLDRWLTPDPDNAGADVSDPQSWNMYSYVGDNPISRTDPSGEDYYLMGGEDCGTDKVQCDKQGYVLGANGQREIVTDQQVLSGAVGSTVGENGISSITTSQGTFQAQFFDTSPATYEVSGQPGSALAAIGLNALFGLSNAASDFFAPIVGFRPSYMQNIPTGTGKAANAGAIATLVGTALIGPGGEEEVVPTAGQIAQAENTLLRDGPGAVEKAIRTFERLLAQHESDLAGYRAAGGFTSKTESEIRNFKQLIKAYRQVLGR